MSLIIGIDPGITGALAIHSGGVLTDLIDLPVLAARVDGAGLAAYLRQRDPDAVAPVYLEDAHAMPRNGSMASFSLGLSSGIIIGVLQSLGHPLFRVRPLKWKTKMGVRHMDKNALRGVAREIYPTWSEDFKRVKDHNRAEAVLISRYGVAVSLEEAHA